MVFHQGNESKTESVACLPSIERLEPRLLLSAPVLTIGGPQANHFITQGTPVEVEYTAASDTAARTNFYLNVTPRIDAVDTAIPVATNLPNTNNGTLTLDTGDLAPGRYFLYGQITDAHGDTVTATWSGVLFVAPADNAQFSYVRIDTTLGPIVLELDRDVAPMTVANFLSYVNTNFYDDVIFHQSSATDHRILAGGYTSEFAAVVPYTWISNENPTNKTDSLSNVRGTIAMYYAGDLNDTVNSHRATSQFFINTDDNSGEYDYLPYEDIFYRTGYCVFGHVILGMDIIDAIAALETTSLGGELSSVPMVDGVPVAILSTVVDRAIATVLLDDTPVTPNPPQEIYWPGGCTDMTFTIRNDGAIDLAVGEIVLSNHHGLEVTLQPDAILAPGESTTFVISAVGLEDEGRYADVTFITNGVEGGEFSFSLTNNLTPTADSQELDMTDTGVVTGTLTGHDTETPDGELTYVIVTQPLHGSVTIVGDQFYYSIGAAYDGSDSFTFAVIDAGYGAAPARTSEPATITLAGGRMVLADAKGVATFVDSAGKVGKVTFKRGTGSLFINDDADGTIGRIFLSGTTDKSTVTIATSSKNARVTLYGIESAGPVASIKGTYVDLVGTVTLGPAVSPKTGAALSFGTINATIESAMPIKSIRATTVGILDTVLNLTAPSLKSLIVPYTLRGDLQIAGAVGTIRTVNLINSRLTIGGTLTGLTVTAVMASTTLDVTGAAGTVRAAEMSSLRLTFGDTFKNIVTTGAMRNSTLTAAGAAGTIKVSGVTDSEMEFGGTLKSVAVKGAAANLSLITSGAVGTIRAGVMTDSYLELGGTLTSVSVTGAMAYSYLSATGAVGTIKAATLQGSEVDLRSTLRSLSVSGWVEDTTVSAAGNVDSVSIGGARRSNFGSGADYELLTTKPVEFGETIPTGTIKSFTVRGVAKQSGAFFENSMIAAGSAGTVTITNWDGELGLYVPAGGAGKVTMKFTAKPPPAYGRDEFVHIL